MKKNEKKDLLDLMDLTTLEIEPLDDAILASIAGGCGHAYPTCSLSDCSEGGTYQN